MKKILLLLILLIGLLISCQAQTYSFGDVVTNPDGSRGVVFYINPSKTGGWMVALEDASSGCQWGESVDIPDLENHDISISLSNTLLEDLDGYSNTQMIRAYQNNNSPYAAGTVDFANGWYLPSAGQMRMLVSQLAFLETVFGTAGGSSLGRSTHYWTSTEVNASQTWYICSNSWGGFFARSNKTGNYAVRAIRDFTMTPPPSGSLTYQWNTGAATPDITVSPIQTTTYTVTVSNGDGFVSTASQTIEVVQNYSTHIYHQTSNSYTWNGTTYNTSGVYSQQFNSQSGCDSIVTLHLTITSPPTVSIVADGDTICESESVTLHAICTVESGPAIGDILCTDGSFAKPADWPVDGKTAKAIVTYVDETDIHGWAIGLNDLGSVKWCQQAVDIAGLTNYTNSRTAIYDFDGYTNTQIIRSAGSQATFPAAWMVDVDQGWYLPAVGQLRCMYAYLYVINESLQIVGGTLFPVSNTWWYWSSTESTNQLKWDLDSNGYADRHDGTVFTWRVRAMCSF